MFGSSEYKRETVKRYTQSRPEQRDIDKNQNTTNKKILNSLDTNLTWYDCSTLIVKSETHWTHQGDDLDQLSTLFYYQISINQIST